MEIDEEEEDDGPIIPSPMQLKDPMEYNSYRGKVIAIQDGEVRASADTWSECGQALRKIGVEIGAVIFMKVPPENFVG